VLRIRIEKCGPALIFKYLDTDADQGDQKQADPQQCYKASVAEPKLFVSDPAPTLE
jgi:hypothetical protein